MTHLSPESSAFLILVAVIIAYFYITEWLEERRKHPDPVSKKTETPG